MKLWKNIKGRVYKNYSGEYWLYVPDAKVWGYGYTYQRVKRKFFFFYHLTDEVVSTNYSN